MLGLPRFTCRIYIIVCSDSENSRRLQVTIQVIIQRSLLTLVSSLTDGIQKIQLDVFMFGTLKWKSMLKIQKLF